jgi:hypothetical protein
MARHQHIEQEDWWPDALAMFAELAAEGKARNTACREVARHFSYSVRALNYVAARGSIPSYPAKDQVRAQAWQAGEVTYDGKVCPKHGTTVRYSNDGACVECMREYREVLATRRSGKKQATPT